MFKIRIWRSLVAVATFGASIGVADAANVRITEWMYNGLGAGSIGEYVELTNVGTTAVSFSGWSFDDNSRAPGSQSLSAFGTVLAGESVILTDDTAAAFRSRWGLAASVKVIGGNTNNLGRADEINIYDNTSALVDRLTYDDQTIGGLRTNGVSGNIPLALLGTNQAALAVKSTVGDGFGSHTNALAEIGNPGVYPAPVPLPAAGFLLLSGLGLFGSAMRRKLEA